MRTLAAGGRAGLLAVAGMLWVGACNDGIRPPVDAGMPVNVSDPAPNVPSSAGGLAHLVHSGSNAAYVSLSPGAAPGGVQAVIRNRRSGASVTAAMIDGGLDPVPVTADPGDTIVIDVLDAGGASLMMGYATVPGSRRPSVVRTQPPPGHRDVPLNSVIVVVFSEPIDPRSASPRTIRVLAAGVQVSGRTTVGVDGFRVEFQADHQLPPRTECILAIDADVADLEGETLAQPVYVKFVTDSIVAGVASLVVDPPTLSLASGEDYTLVAHVYDSTGTELNGLTVHWSSADTTIVAVGTYGMVTGRAPGSAVVKARVDSAIGTATVNVSLNPARILIDASRDGGVWWFPQLDPFEPNQPHQGKALADYLRSRGFVVDELPRGLYVSDALLDQYTHVIRAGLCTPYSAYELQVYARYLTRQVTLLLFGDHLGTPSCAPDNLAAMLGIEVAGGVGGTVATFAPHPVTAGVTDLGYLMGSAIIAHDSSLVDIIGWLQDGTPVMAVVRHPTARIFFLGDLNGVEGLPQPFVDNLITWGF